MTKTATIVYRNHKGSVGVRTIGPFRLYYGSTEYHPKFQWLLEAYDEDKKAMRTFAMADILEWQ